MDYIDACDLFRHNVTIVRSLGMSYAPLDNQPVISMGRDIHPCLRQPVAPLQVSSTILSLIQEPLRLCSV